MIKKNTIHDDPPIVRLLPSPCALCGSYDNSNEIYPSNFDLEAFNPEVFSARRLPDRIHYRMVECKKCNLLRSDPVADSDTLLQLYIKSTFSYGNQINFLKKTYGRYLELAKKVSPNATSLLEIGCGSGFFLEEAIKHGIPNVWGVEPSTNAASQAPINLQKKIILDVMRPNLFPKDTTFDIICLFQVLDHMPDPVGTCDREPFRFAIGLQLRGQYPHDHDYRIRLFGKYNICALGGNCWNHYRHIRWQLYRHGRPCYADLVWRDLGGFEFRNRGDHTFFGSRLKRHYRRGDQSIDYT